MLTQNSPSADQISKLPLQVLAVCDDAQVLRSAADAVRKCQGTLSSAPTADIASIYVAVWRVDGIIIDAAMADTLNLIREIRNGKCNQDSTIFACVNPGSQGTSMIAAGASFVLQKPLVPETLLQGLRAANTMMTERRRHRRFEVTTAVNLTCGHMQHKVTMLNLSEEGAAIRCSEFIAPGKTISFSFQLPNGPLIEGAGEIAWRGCTGIVGIRFKSLLRTGHHDLAQWLTATFLIDENR